MSSRRFLCLCVFLAILLSGVVTPLFQVSVALAASAPNTPSNVSPADGATDVSVTPTLQSSAFSDPDMGDTHAASQWQVTNVPGDFLELVFDSGTDIQNLTEITLPVLNGNTAYYWRVSYQDSSGRWSDWSTPTSFSTLNQPPNTPSNVFPADGATVRTTTLFSSAFSNPADGSDYHAASQWQVTNVPGDYSSTVFDSGTTDTSRTGITIPSEVLYGTTTYHWHVRYQDGHSAWSNWSTETSFTTSEFIWQIQTVDRGSGISSLAFDSAGNPYIAYGGLKYAHFNGTSWDIETVDNAASAMPSLALDAAGYPAIAYTAEAILKYAHFNGTSWDIVNVATEVYGSPPSLAFDSSGNPGIAYDSRCWGDDYYEYYPCHVNYTHFNGASWDTQTLGSRAYWLGSAGNSLVYDGTDPCMAWAGDGESPDKLMYYDGLVVSDLDTFCGGPSLALNALGNPVICCGSLYLIFNGTSWETEPVDMHGSNVRLALDSHDTPSIVLDTDTGLQYARRDSRSWWDTERIDAQGNYPSLAFDSLDNPGISYSESGSLKYAYLALSPPTNTAPNQPANTSPSNGETDVGLAPTLQSSDFTDPDGDSHAASQWQIATIAGDYSNPVFDSGVDTSNLIQVTISSAVLDGNTPYYWHVRYQDNHGAWSEWSVETYFTTMNRLPNQPVNTSPPDGASGVRVTPTLESSPFSDPDNGDTHGGSQWQVTTTAGNYSNPVFDSNTDPLHLTSIGVPSLNYSTAYHWRVRHLDGHGGWSDWSAETSFATATRPPHQPSNVSPVSGLTEVSLTPTLESAAFSDPDSGDTHAASQWQVTSTAGDYSSPVFDSQTDSTNLTSVVVPSGKLAYSTTYYWRVCYKDSQGNWSEWSAETSFTTINRSPDQPTNVSPANGKTGTSLIPTLQASAFSDPDTGDTHSQSQWQITTTAGDYSTPVWDATRSTDLTSCTVPSGTLNHSTDFYWHVRYQDQHGIWSAYSSETSFTTSTRPPGQPSTTSPLNGATEISLTPILQASSFSDPDSGDTHAASQWQITVSSGNYSSTIFDSGTDTGHLTQLDIASGVLGYSNRYYWHVRYQDNRESWSAWSAEASFTTMNREPNQPVNASPSNGTTGLSRTPTLQSSSFSDPDPGDTHIASQWQITSTAGDYSAPPFDSDIDAGHLASIGVPSGALQYSTTYYWRVRHQDSHAAWSPWSVETSFTTAAQPQADFSISSVGSAEGFIVVFFTNLSSGGVTPLTYAWDFENDGTIDATEREPWHRYSTSGTYTVSLSIRDAVGDTDTEVRVNCLTVLSSSGATVETADRQVSTEFPSGAVSGAAMVTIGTRTASGLPDVPGEFIIGDTCFVILALDESGNEIVTLSQPSVITVKYSAADLAAAGGDPHRLVLAYWDEAAGEWKALKTTVDTANKTLSATTTHLSTWAVLGKTTSASTGLSSSGRTVIVLITVLVVAIAALLLIKQLAKQQ